MMGELNSFLLFPGHLHSRCLIRIRVESTRIVSNVESLLAMRSDAFMFVQGPEAGQLHAGRIWV